LNQSGTGFLIGRLGIGTPRHRSPAKESGLSIALEIPNMESERRRIELPGRDHVQKITNGLHRKFARILDHWILQSISAWNVVQKRAGWIVVISSSTLLYGSILKLFCPFG
jgi:hypothetical protein